MRALILLAFILFLGLAACELWPTLWEPKAVPAEVVPDEPEVKPEPRPHVPMTRRWQG